MRIAPAEAALLGTSLGASATFTAAWLTQRATTLRERERRLWDRRVDTYADLMTTVHVFAQDRARLGQKQRPVKEAGHDGGL